jgi:pimeloyl-ACP methyl ester carboxylesterase
VPFVVLAVLKTVRLDEIMYNVPTRRDVNSRETKFACGGIMTLLAIGATSSQAQPSLPSSFHAKTIRSPEGADIFVRWGGKDPVVVLIHGYAENSDSWAPLAEDLKKDYTVVVPDLRGIGKSSKPEGGYDKKTQAGDIRAVVSGLGYDKTFVVAHDIGNMVAYASIYPDKVQRLVVMDAPIPGRNSPEPWKALRRSAGFFPVARPTSGRWWFLPSTRGCDQGTSIVSDGRMLTFRTNSCI